MKMALRVKTVRHMLKLMFKLDRQGRLRAKQKENANLEDEFNSSYKNRIKEIIK